LFCTTIKIVQSSDVIESLFPKKTIFRLKYPQYLFARDSIDIKHNSKLNNQN